MTVLDLFALLVLAVLLVTIIAVWVLIAMLPGWIAGRRHHPQAEAINVCGWFGALTLGVLSPLAFIWAYTKSTDVQSPSGGLSTPTGPAMEGRR